LTESAFYGAMYVLILGAAVLLVGFGFAPDDGFWTAGFLGFVAAFGVIFLAGANLFFGPYWELVILGFGGA
jgi:hypothetical protein